MISAVLINKREPIQSAAFDFVLFESLSYLASVKETMEEKQMSMDDFGFQIGKKSCLYLLTLSKDKIEDIEEIMRFLAVNVLEFMFKRKAKKLQKFSNNTFNLEMEEISFMKSVVATTSGDQSLELTFTVWALEGMIKGALSAFQLKSSVKIIVNMPALLENIMVYNDNTTAVCLNAQISLYEL